MKANHRKATLVIVILLNLLLLGVCGWTLMTLLSPSGAPSEPDSSQSEPASSSEEPSFPSVKPESSTPENSSPTLSLPEGLSLSDRFGNCYDAALNKLDLSGVKYAVCKNKTLADRLIPIGFQKCTGGVEIDIPAFFKPCGGCTKN